MGWSSRSRLGIAGFAITLLSATGAWAAPVGWTEKAPLTASDAGTNDSFGNDVVISSSGTTAIVGAGQKKIGDAGGQGAAYVFVRAGGTWTFQAELRASDGAHGDGFGDSVATTKDGSTVVIGAPFKRTNDIETGAAYVFTRSGTTWKQTSALTPNPLGRGTGFGVSVGINGTGTIAAVGATTRSVSGHRRAGAAFVFTRAKPAWKQAALLTATDAAANDYFGWAVAVKETQVLVSTPLHVNAIGSGGAVYSFDKPDGTYAQQTVLTAPGGKAGDHFGWSLDVSVATLVVGAPDHVSAHGRGAVYVFTHSDRTHIWRARTELDPSDGTAGGDFGEAVALSDETAVIADTNHDVGTHAAQGVAYVFTGSGSTWSQQTELTPADADQFTSFGLPLAVGGGGTTIMVGEPLHDVGGISSAGRVDVFEPS